MAQPYNSLSQIHFLRQQMKEREREMPYQQQQSVQSTSNLGYPSVEGHEQLQDTTGVAQFTNYQTTSPQFPQAPNPPIPQAGPSNHRQSTPQQSPTVSSFPPSHTVAYQPSQGYVQPPPVQQPQLQAQLQQPQQFTDTLNNGQPQAIASPTQNAPSWVYQQQGALPSSSSNGVAQNVATSSGAPPNSIANTNANNVNNHLMQLSHQQQQQLQQQQLQQQHHPYRRHSQDHQPSHHQHQHPAYQPAQNPDPMGHRPRPQAQYNTASAISGLNSNPDSRRSSLNVENINPNMRPGNSSSPTTLASSSSATTTTNFGSSTSSTSHSNSETTEINSQLVTSIPAHTTSTSTSTSSSSSHAHPAPAASPATTQTTFTTMIPLPQNILSIVQHQLAAAEVSHRKAYTQAHAESWGRYCDTVKNVTESLHTGYAKALHKVANEEKRKWSEIYNKVTGEWRAREEGWKAREEEFRRLEREWKAKEEEWKLKEGAYKIRDGERRQLEAAYRRGLELVAAQEKDSGQRDLLDANNPNSIPAIQHEQLQVVPPNTNPRVDEVNLKEKAFLYFNTKDANASWRTEAFKGAMQASHWMKETWKARETCVKYKAKLADLKTEVEKLTQELQMQRLDPKNLPTTISIRNTQTGDTEEIQEINPEVFRLSQENARIKSQLAITMEQFSNSKEELAKSQSDTIAWQNSAQYFGRVAKKLAQEMRFLSYREKQLRKRLVGAGVDDLELELELELGLNGEEGKLIGAIDAAESRRVEKEREKNKLVQDDHRGEEKAADESEVDDSLTHLMRDMDARRLGLLEAVVKIELQKRMDAIQESIGLSQSQSQSQSQQTQQDKPTETEEEVAGDSRELPSPSGPSCLDPNKPAEHAESHQEEQMDTAEHEPHSSLESSEVAQPFSSSETLESSEEAIAAIHQGEQMDTGEQEPSNELEPELRSSLESNEVPQAVSNSETLEISEEATSPEQRPPSVSLTTEPLSAAPKSIFQDYRPNSPLLSDNDDDDEEEALLYELDYPPTPMPATNEEATPPSSPEVAQYNKDQPPAENRPNRSVDGDHSTTEPSERHTEVRESSTSALDIPRATSLKRCHSAEPDKSRAHVVRPRLSLDEAVKTEEMDVDFPLTTRHQHEDPTTPASPPELKEEAEGFEMKCDQDDESWIFASGSGRMDDEYLEEGELLEDEDEPDFGAEGEIGLEHIDMFFKMEDGVIRCRMCETRNADDLNKNSLPTNPAWPELLEHCTTEHPIVCADAKRLLPSQIAELKEKLGVKPDESVIPMAVVC